MTNQEAGECGRVFVRGFRVAWEFLLRAATAVLEGGTACFNLTIIGVRNMLARCNNCGRRFCFDEDEMYCCMANICLWPRAPIVRGSWDQGSTRSLIISEVNIV